MNDFLLAGLALSWIQFQRSNHQSFTNGQYLNEISFQCNYSSIESLEARPFLIRKSPLQFEIQNLNVYSDRIYKWRKVKLNYYRFFIKGIPLTHYYVTIADDEAPLGAFSVSISNPRRNIQDSGGNPLHNFHYIIEKDMHPKSYQQNQNETLGFNRIGFKDFPICYTTADQKLIERVIRQLYFKYHVSLANCHGFSLLILKIVCGREAKNVHGYLKLINGVPGLPSSLELLNRWVSKHESSPMHGYRYENNIYDKFHDAGPSETHQVSQHR